MANNPPSLLKHGSYTNPNLAAILDTIKAKGVSDDELQSSAQEIVNARQTDTNKASGWVKTYDKTESVSNTPYAFDLIANANDDAILYASPQSMGMRGMAMMYGLMVLGMGVFMAYMCINALVNDKTYIAIPFIPIFFIAGILGFLWTSRHELFQVIDYPVIFDRKHRKIYRVLSEVHGGLKGLFKPWPMRICEYDWDLTYAQHYVDTRVNTAVVSRRHQLTFTVQRSADDVIPLDTFQIGNATIMISDETVDSVYEHIRRFMEENGPPMPDGVPFVQAEPRQSVVRYFKTHHPFRLAYWETWIAHLPMMLLLHALFPVTIVFGGAWVFFNWLSLKTAKDIEWPQDVIDAVGPDVAAPIVNGEL